MRSLEAGLKEDRPAARSAATLMRLFVAGAALLLAACATSLPTGPRVESYARVSQPGTALFAAIEAETGTRLGLTGAVPLLDGRDALSARLAVIDAATDTIDMQYYLFAGDTSGRMVAAALLDAADRGVRVRVLLDDLEKRSDKMMKAISSHPHIEIRLFNPFINRGARNLEMIGSLARHNHRMHNKSLTIDGRIAIVGGRNIGDEYFLLAEDTNFADLDLLLIGAGVAGVLTQFDTYWNSPYAWPVGAVATKSQDPAWTEAARSELTAFAASARQDPALRDVFGSRLLAPPFKAGDWHWGPAQVLFDPLPAPGDDIPTDGLLVAQLRTLLEEAEDEALIVSPYFVPTKPGVSLFQGMQAKGANVTVVTNSLAATDVVAVHGGYKKYRRPLLREGIALREVKVEPNAVGGSGSGIAGSSKASLHAKTFVLDDETVFVGSFNFDPRSAFLNTEMGVVVKSSSLAAALRQALEPCFTRNCYELYLTEKDDLRWRDPVDGSVSKSDPDASFWRRLGAWFIGLFGIEKQL